MPHEPTRLPITRIARLWAAETEQPSADSDGIADDLVEAALRGDFQFPVEIVRRDELVAMLVKRLPELARELLPGGVRNGADWVQVSKDKDGPGGSICVHLEGQHACTWSRLQPRLLGTSAAVRSGDALDLIAYLIGNDDQDQAAQWALTWLGLPAPTNIDIRLRLQVESFFRDDTPADANSLQLQLKASTNDEEGRQWLARNVLISNNGLRLWCTSPEFSEWARTRMLRRPQFIGPTDEKDMAEPYRTGMPGRPSIAHLIEAEFSRRVIGGNALSGLAAEARHLHTWATSKHPKAPTTTPGTIENHIRDAHRRAFKKATK